MRQNFIFCFFLLLRFLGFFENFIYIRTRIRQLLTWWFKNEIFIWVHTKFDIKYTLILYLTDCRMNIDGGIGGNCSKVWIESLAKPVAASPNNVSHVQPSQPNLPRTNKHGRKRPYTKKYDDLHGRVLRPYISVTVYGEIRWFTEKKTVVYCLRTRKPYTVSVLLHFSPYTLVFFPYTVVYDRLRSP